MQIQDGRWKSKMAAKKTIEKIFRDGNCRFSTETFWRLVFSHEWFVIHLQRDEVELEMNSEPRVWEHQSPKCWVGELCSLPPHYCEI